MNIYGIHAESLAQHQAELGEDCPVFKWAGKNYRIVPGSVSFNKPLREGGLVYVFDVSFTAPVAQFISDTRPDAAAVKNKLLNTMLVYLGEPYRISNVTLAPGAAQMTIAAMSAAQNA